MVKKFIIILSIVFICCLSFFVFNYLKDNHLENIIDLEENIDSEIDIDSDENIQAEYVIITDYRTLTLQNDGGSHYNIYYEIDNGVVKKLEDYYVGFKGYKYKRKIIYEKKLSNDLENKLIELMDLLIQKEDLNDTNNYSSYVIKKSDVEKEIFSENSISQIENILSEIDKFK